MFYLVRHALDAGDAFEDVPPRSKITSPEDDVGDIRDDDDDREREDDDESAEGKQLTLRFAVKWKLDKNGDVEGTFSSADSEKYSDDETYKRAVRVADLLQNKGSGKVVTIRLGDKCHYERRTKTMEKQGVSYERIVLTSLCDRSIKQTMMESVDEISVIVTWPSQIIFCGCSLLKRAYFFPVTI